MLDVLARLHERLETALDRALGDVRGMSEDQRAFRTAEGAWAPTQVLHHLLLVQSLSLGAMEKMRGQAARRRTWKNGLGRWVVALVLRLGIKVRNPAPPTTPDPSMTFDELEAEWAVTRSRLAEFLESLDEQGARHAGMKHPISGPLNVEDSMVFLARHAEHHLRQLKRIQEHADFPTG